jgi:chemotaxis family two-component system response regulator Rcp1
MGERNESQPGSHPCAVLLVEDNEVDIFIITEILKKCGFDFKLDVTTNGESALSFLEGVDGAGRPACPELVLLDLNLPKRSGIEVLSHIRRGPRCNHVPVVIVTSSEAPDDIEAAHILNATAYFVKPTNLAAYMELAEVICHALPGRRKSARCRTGKNLQQNKQNLRAGHALQIGVPPCRVFRPEVR